jgi:hypothetical protein
MDRRSTGAVGRSITAPVSGSVRAVGLAPILVYWAAGVIGRAFRRKRGGPRTGSQPLETVGRRSDMTGASRLRLGEAALST